MDDYDEAYSRDEFYWGLEPNDLARTAMEFLNRSGFVRPAVIDIGCGEGRDALFFAESGCAVTAVDISAKGLRKLKDTAERRNLTINTIREDLNVLRLDRSYHLIYSSGAMTFSSPGAREDIFENYIASTSIRGINAFNAFVEKPFVETPPDWGSRESYFGSGDLLSYYGKWDVLRNEEKIFDCTSSGVPHRHAMETVIARKRDK